MCLSCGTTRGFTKRCFWNYHSAWVDRLCHYFFLGLGVMKWCRRGDDGCTGGNCVSASAMHCFWCSALSRRMMLDQCSIYSVPLCGAPILSGRTKVIGIAPLTALLSNPPSKQPNEARAGICHQEIRTFRLPQRPPNADRTDREQGCPTVGEKMICGRHFFFSKILARS